MTYLQFELPVRTVASVTCKGQTKMQQLRCCMKSKTYKRYPLVCYVAFLPPQQQQKLFLLDIVVAGTAVTHSLYFVSVSSCRDTLNPELRPPVEACVGASRLADVRKV